MLAEIRGEKKPAAPAADAAAPGASVDPLAYVMADIRAGKGTAAAKFAALEAAGITTVHSPAEMGAAIAKRLTGKSRKTARSKRRPVKSSVKAKRTKITARRRARRPK